MKLNTILFALWLAACPAWAGGWKTVRKIAQVAVAATTAGDMATSWQAGQRGAVEVNPICSDRFGLRQTAILGGMTAGEMVLQLIVMRHHPELEKRVAIADFGAAGLHGWMIVRNSQIRRIK